MFPFGNRVVGSVSGLAEGILRRESKPRLDQNKAGYYNLYKVMGGLRWNRRSPSKGK